VESTSHLQNAILQTIRALASTLKFTQQSGKEKKNHRYDNWLFSNFIYSTS
jgi:hypothetical protein